MDERQGISPATLGLHFIRVLRTSGIFLAVGIFIGTVLILVSQYLKGSQPIQGELMSHIGVGFLVAAVSIFVIEWREHVSKMHRFVDADTPFRSRLDEKQIVNALLQEIRAQGQQATPDYDKIVEEAFRKAFERQTGPLNPQSFAGYFSSITDLLQDKADVSDRKASILLDRGVAYTKFGIGFYIVSIAAWQFLAWGEGGFKTQFIYGIASCSLLFLFVEFLSAWFLKQYRHFVDTSTFLVKLKAVFDRYMLIYLLSKEYSPESQSSIEGTKSLLFVLGQEIGWPDSYIFDGKNLSFAKETVEGLASLAQQLKGPGSNRGSEKSA